MVPPSLQKNIRELDRQISLLETECENMEAENWGTSSGKSSSKLPPHLTKVFNLPPMPRMHSQSFFKNNAIGYTSRSFEDLEKSECENHSNRSLQKGKSQDNEGNNQDEVREGSLREAEISSVSFEAKKPRKNSAESIREETESSDEINVNGLKNAKQKHVSTETSKEQQIWCELIRESVVSDKWQNSKNNKKKSDKKESFYKQNPRECKFSSDEEFAQSKRKAGRKSFSEKSARESEQVMTAHSSKLSAKRRSRSARTRKKSDEIPLDLNITKSIHEKEIERFRSNDDREKAEFLLNLNESIKTLHLLIDELKTKSSREKKNDILNDVQNALTKIIDMKSLNALNVLTAQKRIDSKPLEREENIVEMKEALSAVRKFCRDLTEEKSALSEELNTKNNIITNLRSKEKEYVSLISSLKFNLERLKEECEENKLAKRDLLVVKAKLREEEKVIEALKKGHGKMQALIEHYVLANDKLRAEMKMSKLESQKFHVLLAAKEMEINKYKQEIESFQKRITQQLSLLRSKATGNSEEEAIEAISNQTNILEAETDFAPSESASEREESNFVLLTEFASKKTPAESRNENKTSFGDKVPTEKSVRKKESMKLSSSSRELKDGDANLKDGGFTSCKSDNSAMDMRTEDRYHSSKVRGVLSGSKNSRSCVNEMLQEIQGDSTEKLWPGRPNSDNSSQCSTLSSCSDNVKEYTQRD